MDRDHFDNFARALGGTSTRRRFSALLLGLGVGSTAGLSLLEGDAEAKNKNKTKAKRRRTRKRKQARKDDADGGAGGGTGGGGGGTGDPVCVPDCTGPLGPKQCGADGCGGECGQCPLLLPICSSVTFTCEAII